MNGLIRLLLLFNLVLFSLKAQAQPTEDDAAAWLEDFQRNVTQLSRESGLASWKYNTNITDETQKIMIEAEAEVNNFITASLESASAFFPFSPNYLPETRRKLALLKLYGGKPKDAAARDRLSKVISDMESIYSSSTVCLDGRNDSCAHLDPELEAIMANPNSTYDELLRAWKGWRDAVGPEIRPLYTEYVALSNEGARDYGFADASAFWLAGYDAPPSQFVRDIENLWNQVYPLYEQLHCYTRTKLQKKYGESKVPSGKPIPAHLLGNMWAQSWDALYPLLVPYPNEAPLDIASELQEKVADPEELVRLGEGLYTRLGLPSLPGTFWNLSMFERPPPPRDVVCHASAWDLGRTSEGELDLRIKQCIKIKEEDYFVIAHELGHIFYDQAYSIQPYLYRGGANDGFHEAIGDTVRLSLTPEYLAQMGLLENGTLSREGLLNFQMKVALEKLAFLPFGYLIDQYRWKVFQGTFNESNYNAKWWKLREQYQGVSPPVDRSENDFDPGAKYHVPANVPYLRYFIAHILQFQFHRALCEESGYTGPLHSCSIFLNETGAKAAGDKFEAMLRLGQSEPWQDALFALASTHEMNASGVVEYFAPLLEWLEEQNQGVQCGWATSNDDPAEEDEGGILTSPSKVVIIVFASLFGALLLIASIWWYRRRSTSHHYIEERDHQGSEIAPVRRRSTDGGPGYTNI